MRTLPGFDRCFCFIALALLVFALPSPALAVEWDANGGIGGDFATGVNWVGDVAPSFTDLAKIDAASSAANPVTLASGSIEVDNVDLGSTTASFMEVNGGTIIIDGTSTSDFKIGVGATAQSVFTLSSGMVEFGFAGDYSDSNDFDIGKNGNGKYVQTGGTFKHHADDFKVADSAGGTGLAEVSGGNLWIADGFSISDNAGGTGTLNLSGNANVVSGNSEGAGSDLGTTAEGYVSIANNGGTGALNISGNATFYGRKLEYRGEPGASATITVGGASGKLIVSEELVRGFPDFGSNDNVMGAEPGPAGQITVQESGLFAVDNPTDIDYSDGYVFGRTGGSGSLTVGGTDAKVVVRQRLLLGSGDNLMDLELGDAVDSAPGSGSMTVSSGARVVVSELHVGTTGTGTLTQTGGTLKASNSDPLYAEAGFGNGTKGEDIFIGSMPGSNGTYNHSGGSVSTGDDFIIGDWGTGVYNMSGTALVDGVGWTVLGNEVGSSGTWNMSGGEYNQSFGDLEIGDAGEGELNFSGGTINVSGYTAIGHREGAGSMVVSGTAILNTPDLKILMGKEGFTTTSGILRIRGAAAQINVANTFTMDESSLGNENKIIAELTTGGITTISVGDTASIDQGALEVESDAGVYKPTAGDQYVLIDAAGGWDGSNDFASVNINVTLADDSDDGDILLRGTGFSGAGGSANKYELRVTSRGDFNGDFNVDGTDFSTWAANFSSLAGTYAGGDADEDGDVDGHDFLAMQRNFGAVGASGVVISAVPEPAGIAIALFGLAFGLLRRNRD